MLLFAHGSYIINDFPDIEIKLFKNRKGNYYYQFFKNDNDSKIYTYLGNNEYKIVKIINQKILFHRLNKFQKRIEKS